MLRLSTYSLKSLLKSSQAVILRSLCTEVGVDKRKAKTDVDVTRLNVFIKERRTYYWKDPEWVARWKKAKNFKVKKKTKGEKKNWDGYELTADHVFWERYHKQKREHLAGYLTSNSLDESLMPYSYSTKEVDATHKPDMVKNVQLSPWQKWLGLGALGALVIGYATFMLMIGGKAEAESFDANGIIAPRRDEHAVDQ